MEGSRTRCLQGNVTGLTLIPFTRNKPGHGQNNRNAFRLALILWFYRYFYEHLFFSVFAAELIHKINVHKSMILSSIRFY